MSTATWQIFEDTMKRLRPEGRVAVGVSGGADSMALLHLLCAWNKSAGNTLELTALTVDHGLREDSAREAAAVSGWARDLDIPHHTLVWNSPKPSGNIEAKAREARYRLMGEWCLENHVQVLMTAHHFDDQAETFLMRLARGSGVSGLAAMAEERPLGGAFASIRLLRPLLQISRSDLTGLLEEVGQPWLEDPSNKDDDFTRSRFRNMRATFDALGLTAERMVATADRMSEANIVLEHAADQFWDKGAGITPFGEIILDLEPLLAIAGDTRRRVLARALRGVSGAPFAPRYERLLRLEDAIRNGQVGKGVTLHGCKISETGGALSIIREVGRSDIPKMPAAAGGLWDGRFDIEWPDGAKVEVEIGYLGETGLKELRKRQWTPPEGAPRRDVMLTLPAAWRDDQLLSVPLLGFESGHFKARFMLFA